MEKTTARVVGWSVTVGAIGLVVAGTAALVAAQVPFATVEGSGLILLAPMGIAWPTAGALILSHRSRHPLGWLLLAGASAGVSFAAWSWAFAATGLGLPAAAAAATVASLAQIPPFLVIMPLVLLLFPDGQLISRRWRAFPVLVAGGAVAQVLAVLLDGYVPGIGVLLIPAGAVLVVVAILAGIAGAVLRYRSARGVRRQQMKLFAAAGAVVGAALVATALGGGGVDRLAELALGLAVPATIAAAISQYRLYEIDRIVSRTVSYTGLTLVLVIVYVVSVVGLGAIVRGLTGGGGGDLVVAGSTLLVAAAFGPVRRWFQAAVDRRFNRSGYDAVRTVEAFGQHLRDETNLDTLADELVGVLRGSVQPSYAAVWLVHGGARS